MIGCKLGTSLTQALYLLKMAAADRILTISYVNIRGQTGLHLDKQLQLEEFIKRSNCDIIHLQEAHIEDDTFCQCYFIESNFSVLINNAENKYGTASLVKNDLVVENVLCDTGGRVLTFDVSGVTFVNIVTAQLSLNSSWDRQSNQLDHHPHHPLHPPT